MLDVVSKLGEEIEDFLNSVRSHVISGKLHEGLDHRSVDVEFTQVGKSFNGFSNLFNFTFKLDPASSLL